MNGPIPLVLLETMAPERFARFAALVPTEFAFSAAAGGTAQDRLAAIRGARFAIIGQSQVTAGMIRAGAAAGLRAIHKWGVGYDNIDIDAARAVGVRVLRTTGSNALPVAETTLAMMLALQRSVALGHARLAAGEWRPGAFGAHTALLSGRTVGLIGFGPIARHLARLLAPFGCRILYAKPAPIPNEEATALGVTHAPLEALLAEADIVSLHCALTAQTRGMIDAVALARMKPGALLVNTARGGLVDEAAVAASIRTGHLRGAAFDVFAEEPPRPDNPLLGLANVIATPHIAAQASDTFAPTVSRMMENLSRLAAGLPPRDGDLVV